MISNKIRERDGLTWAVTSRLISEAFRVTATIRSDPTIQTTAAPRWPAFSEATAQWIARCGTCLRTCSNPKNRSKSPWGSRKLTAGFRNPVKPRDAHANTHMAWFVWKRASEGVGVEGAIREAVDTFDVTRERMYDLWKAYKPGFEAIEGPIRGKRKG